MKPADRPQAPHWTEVAFRLLPFADAASADLPLGRLLRRTLAQAEGRTRATAQMRTAAQPQTTAAAAAVIPDKDWRGRLAGYCNRYQQVCDTADTVMAPAHPISRRRYKCYRMLTLNRCVLLTDY